MGDIVIREYQSEDQARVIELWQECGLIVPHNDPAKDIDYCTSSGHGRVFVGCEGEAMAATVMVGHDGHRGWIYYLAVAPALQGQGWGRRIVQHAEQFLAGQSIRKVQLMVRTSNEAVIAFYERLGYEQQEVAVLGKWLSGDGPASTR